MWRLGMPGLTAWSGVTQLARHSGRRDIPLWTPRPVRRRDSGRRLAKVRGAARNHRHRGGPENANWR